MNVPTQNDYRKVVEIAEQATGVIGIIRIYHSMARLVWNEALQTEREDTAEYYVNTHPIIRVLTGVMGGLTGLGRDTQTFEQALRICREQAGKPEGAIVYTNAPVDYDYSYCRTLEKFEHDGLSWRKVHIEALPYHVDYQSNRYLSGLHVVRSEDPREE